MPKGSQNSKVLTSFFMALPPLLSCPLLSCGCITRLLSCGCITAFTTHYNIKRGGYNCELLPYSGDGGSSKITLYVTS